MSKNTPNFPQNISKKEEETIAAISTPFGESGIGIVRMSGPLSESITKRLFRSKKESSSLISHHFYYGEVIDPGSRIPVDEVLVVLMKSPKTYTKEDMSEIHCHGGFFILHKVLELVLGQGARIAQPGEFTKRAFLNGRIDLTQAEAVIDVIKARTKTSLEIAGQQLRGKLYNEISSLKGHLIKHLALIEAHIDFPEEEIEPIIFEKTIKDLNGLIRQVEGWISSFEEGRIFREGVSCAISGKTNVGKSSLLNVLLRQERAIVTPVPGTTRDVIEEVLNIKGIPVRLIDTAGLRKAKDSIEREGMRRARERVSGADLVLLIIDGSRGLDNDDDEIFRETETKKKVVVVNKKDLPTKISMEELKRKFSNEALVTISAKKNEGIEELKHAIHSTLFQREMRISPEGLIVANIRHKIALVNVKESLINSLKALEGNESLEFVAFEIRDGLEALGDMVGETTSEEILNLIFNQFCIGK